MTKFICCLRESVCGHFSDMAALADDVRCRIDSVAKLSLRRLASAGAAHDRASCITGKR
jgi:hypothetical protein